MLAVEIRQYIGEGLKTLVPRVIGQTQGTREPTKQWDEACFFDDLSIKGGSKDVDVARKILECAKRNATGIWWGKGRVTGSFVPTYDTSKGQHYQLFAVFSSTSIQIYFGAYKVRPEFKDESKRIELVEKLNAIAGINIPRDGIDRYPSIQLSALKGEKELNQFFETYEWFLDVIK